MATHSSILAWRIPWTEELGGLLSIGSVKSQTLKSAHAHTHARTHTHENCKPQSQLDCMSSDNHHPGGGENQEGM